MCTIRHQRAQVRSCHGYVYVPWSAYAYVKYIMPMYAGQPLPHNSPPHHARRVWRVHHQQQRGRSFLCALQHKSYYLELRTTYCQCVAIHCQFWHYNLSSKSAYHSNSASPCWQSISRCRGDVAVEKVMLSNYPPARYGPPSRCHVRQGLVFRVYQLCLAKEKSWRLASGNTNSHPESTESRLYIKQCKYAGRVKKHIYTALWLDSG